MSELAEMVAKSVMEVMDRSGHTEVQWDPDNATEVAKAGDLFRDLLGRGYAAYKMSPDGRQGEQITAFDPYAGRILMHSAMVGG